METNKKMSKDQEKFRNLEKEIEKGFIFTKGDMKKKFTKKNIVMAGALAYELTEEEAHKSEFFNLFLSILYGNLKFE